MLIAELVPWPQTSTATSTSQAAGVVVKRGHVEPANCSSYPQVSHIIVCHAKVGCAVQMSNCTTAQHTDVDYLTAVGRTVS